MTTKKTTTSRKRVWFGGAAAASLLWCVAAIISGCSPIQRHAVLDFVFDGVPPYRTPEERLRLEAEAEAELREELVRRGRRGRYEEVEKISRFVHGPYAAKECGRCHDLQGSSGFRQSGFDEAPSQAASADLAEAGRLRYPLPELCVRCHAEYAPDDPSNADLWVHGPVANGWCVTCHQSHSSHYPALVYSEPPARLCGQCHMREDLVAFTPEHRPVDPEVGYPPPPPEGELGDGPDDASAAAPVVRVVADCTRCHDPHRGPDHNILKARSEWETPPAPEVAPPPEAAPAPEEAVEAGSDVASHQAVAPS